MQVASFALVFVALSAGLCAGLPDQDYAANINTIRKALQKKGPHAFSDLRNTLRDVDFSGGNGRSMSDIVSDVAQTLSADAPSPEPDSNKRSVGFQVQTELHAFQASKNEPAKLDRESSAQAEVKLEADKISTDSPRTSHSKRYVPSTEECVEEADQRSLLGTSKAISLAHNVNAETDERERALRSLVPKLDVRWSRKESGALTQLVFDVEAPFVANEARWIIDFKPLQADHRQAHRELVHPSACAMHFGAFLDLPQGAPVARDDETDAESSASFDTSEEPLDLIGEWRSADNALQRGAFSDIVRYPASFVSQRSRWRARAQSCSRVSYTARFELDELMRCADALAVVRGDSGDEQTVLGALHVTLATPTNPRLAGAVMHFSLSVDERGNALLLRSESPMPDQHAAPLVELRAAAFAHTPAPMAHVELLTQSASALRLERVELIDSGSTIRKSDIASSQTRVPQSRIDGAYQVQRWQLSGARSMYENESLQVTFSRDETMDGGAGAWRDSVVARLSASLDDKPALERTQIDAAQTGLSQTVDGVPAHVDAERMVAVRDGARICQIVNIAVPPALAPLVEIDVTGANLCPELIGAERSCTDSPLAFDLFVEPDANATVFAPGPFGATSAQVCFTARNSFFNPKSVKDARAPRQRFEAHARLAARGTAKRQQLLRWIRAAEDDAIDGSGHAAHTYAESATLSPEHRSLDYREGLLRAARFRPSGSVRDAYAHSELADSLRVARLERKLDDHEHVGDTFAVLGADADKDQVERAAMRHNISDRSAWLAIIVIAAVCACTCILYAVATLRGGYSIFGSTSKISDSVLHTHFRRPARH